MAATHQYEVHQYEVTVRWTGNRGAGTRSYRGYDRTHEVRAIGKPAIAGSADPTFRGDADRWNPEELLVAALSQCHMLWYLHLAAVEGVVVTGYADTAVGTMREDGDGGGQFSGVVLRPAVTVADSSMSARAQTLHADANATCFIARSVNFPVRHEPTVHIGPLATTGDAVRDVPRTSPHPRA
ncbi:MAG TPA: OsmC family protein [Mycobacteriales bacterium]|nr:OsmC family protein [Mycobacteriales bacterium]